MAARREDAPASASAVAGRALEARSLPAHMRAVPCRAVPHAGEDNLIFVANDWHTSLLPFYLQVGCRPAPRARPPARRVVHSHLSGWRCLTALVPSLCHPALAALQAHYRDYGKFHFARSVLVLHNVSPAGQHTMRAARARPACFSCLHWARGCALRRNATCSCSHAFKPCGCRQHLPRPGLRRPFRWPTRAAGPWTNSVTSRCLSTTASCSGGRRPLRAVSVLCLPRQPRCCSPWLLSKERAAGSRTAPRRAAAQALPALPCRSAPPAWPPLRAAAPDRARPSVLPACRLYDPVGGEHMNIMKAGIITAHRWGEVPGARGSARHVVDNSWARQSSSSFCHAVLREGVPRPCVRAPCVPASLCSNFALRACWPLQDGRCEPRLRLGVPDPGGRLGPAQHLPGARVEAAR